MQKAAHWRAWSSIARMQLAHAKATLLSMSLRERRANWLFW